MTGNCPSAWISARVLWKKRVTFETAFKLRMKKKNPDSENEKRARIKKEASDWVVKQSFDYSPEDQDAFFEWLAADPQHAGAYASHQEAWKRASILADVGGFCAQISR